MIEWGKTKIDRKIVKIQFKYTKIIEFYQRTLISIKEPSLT